ncbi:hypothetical protein C8Q75DRAFT_283275 [Abortiporus biennis]|nr:hypothetical protein C8Q75DRAFT_283275 [Abortiporus biennis]
MFVVNCNQNMECPCTCIRQQVQKLDQELESEDCKWHNMRKRPLALVCWTYEIVSVIQSQSQLLTLIVVLIEYCTILVNASGISYLSITIGASTNSLVQIDSQTDLAQVSIQTPFC